MKTYTLDEILDACAEGKEQAERDSVIVNKDPAGHMLNRVELVALGAAAFAFKFADTLGIDRGLLSVSNLDARIKAKAAKAAQSV